MNDPGATVDDSLTWADNGFWSQEGMDQMHACVLRGVEDSRIDRYDRIVDFGCGNGVLLKKLHDKHGLQMIGVEKRLDVARRAKCANPNFIIHSADIWECASHIYSHDLATFGMIAVKRLYHAANPTDAVHGLMNAVNVLYVYSYDVDVPEAPLLHEWISGLYDISALSFGCLIERRLMTS